MVEDGIRDRLFLTIDHQLANVFGDAAWIGKLNRLTLRLILEGDFELGIDKGNILQVRANHFVGKLRARKDFLVWSEEDRSAVSAEWANLLQLRGWNSARVLLSVFEAVAMDGGNQVL